MTCLTKLHVCDIKSYNHARYVGLRENKQQTKTCLTQVHAALTFCKSGH